ncbi:hypothetical protein LFE_1327 [Leptospirillum ferrooxidans C2-3]|uniref:Uncharacterized protein n=1 Tax=Leptospirillum ferrooxidans (strain C2-3) TaxID=1162668 RepID=I0IP11_LEPFC|nr:hypothetical protein [Leptospirillum ferrooxidans]BAM07010.1 hypothetical protein LFE_1327 [Leptospirillum ferrooxidans C2-3]
MMTVSSFMNARMMSGIKRSSAQSPPPITFPALADDSATPWQLKSPEGKKEFLNADVTSSEQALLLL